MEHIRNCMLDYLQTLQHRTMALLVSLSLTLYSQDCDMLFHHLYEILKKQLKC